MVLHAYTPSAGEVEAGGWGVQDYGRLHAELEANLDIGKAKQPIFGGGQWKVSHLGFGVLVPHSDYKHSSNLFLSSDVTKDKYGLPIGKFRKNKRKCLEPCHSSGFVGLTLSSALTSCVLNGVRATRL